MKPVPIPKDLVKRAELAEMAGLTEEERLAIDVWCYQQEVEYRNRLRQAENRHLTREGDAK